MTPSPRYSQASPKLSAIGATAIGVASMLGAGVYIVFSPAAKLAGSSFLFAILIAALVAYLNARSIAQLARVLPRAGGAYSYAREFISADFGFAAGSAFIFGKIGSVASIAFVVANYVDPNFSQPIAIAALAAMTAINLLGVNRTALGAMLLALPTILLLGTLFLIGFSVPQEPVQLAGDFSLTAILSASALIFFAFAGYARVATLGDEVREPSKNIPLAIGLSFAIVLVFYLATGFSLQQNLGASLADSASPVLALSQSVIPWLASEIVVATAAAAALGSLLSLLAGISRTCSIMAKDGELPSILGIQGKRFGTPWVAEIFTFVVGCALILTGDVVWTIGISSCSVLIYYAIANIAAFRQSSPTELGKRILSAFGFISCVGLALAVPLLSLALTAVVLAATLLLRLGLRRVSKSS